jgi:hypothetical protein
MAEGADLTTPTIRLLSESDARWMRAAVRRTKERDSRAAECRVSTVMQRFLVDTMAYYRLAASRDRCERAGLLCLAGHLGLLMTDIQHEQISNNPDPETVVQVLSIPAINVPAFGVVLGVSRLNMARFGDPDLLARLRSPGDDEVPPWPKTPRVPPFGEDRTPRLRSRHTGDALLATSAWHERAVLVTRDRRLTNFAIREGVVVWHPDRFLDHVDHLAHAEGCYCEADGA